MFLAHLLFLISAQLFYSQGSFDEVFENQCECTDCFGDYFLGEVRSGSMKPNLLVSDIYAAYLVSARYRSTGGGIVIIRRPRTDRQFKKRIIAIGGGYRWN